MGNLFTKHGESPSLSPSSYYATTQVVRDTEELRIIVVTNSILEAYLYVADKAVEGISSNSFQYMPGFQEREVETGAAAALPSNTPSFFKMYFAKDSPVYNTYQKLRRSLFVKENSGETTNLAECIKMTTQQSVEDNAEDVLKQLEVCSQLINQHKFYTDILYLHRRWYLNLCIRKACENIVAYTEEYSAGLRKKVSGEMRRNVFDMEKGQTVVGDVDKDLQTQLAALLEVKKRIEYLNSYISVINAFICYIVKDLPMRQNGNLLPEIESALNKKLAFLVSDNGRMVVREMTANLQRGTTEVLTTPFLTEMMERLLSIIRFPTRDYIETIVYEGATIEALKKGVIDLELSVDLSLCGKHELPPVNPLIEELSRVKIPSAIGQPGDTNTMQMPMPMSTTGQQDQQPFLEPQYQNREEQQLPDGDFF